jgi:hypothetical protein
VDCSYSIYPLATFGLEEQLEESRTTPHEWEVDNKESRKSKELKSWQLQSVKTEGVGSFGGGKGGVHTTLLCARAVGQQSSPSSRLPR